MQEPRKILVPVDQSKTSIEALEYAISLAHKYDARIIALTVFNSSMLSHGYMNVVDVGAIAEKVAKGVDDELKALIGRYPDERARMEGVVLKGTPYLKILEYAKRENVDLIVLGSHGHTALHEILIGGTAEKVVRRAHCPVLTIRATD